LREDKHLGGGDDPLGGPIFPRNWTKGEAADVHKMSIAAASLMTASKATAPQGVALLEEALKVAGSERERANILLALMAGYHVQRDFANIAEVSSALLKGVPESRLASTET
jgi:hypothetical protein